MIDFEEYLFAVNVGKIEEAVKFINLMITNKDYSIYFDTIDDDGKDLHKELKNPISITCMKLIEN